MAPAPGARVLDVGFGGGYTLERLAPLVSPQRVAGVELSEAMIAAVRQRCGDAFDLHLADAAALPFPEAPLPSIALLLAAGDALVVRPEWSPIRRRHLPAGNQWSYWRAA